jgi:hypothetical protein
MDSVSMGLLGAAQIVCFSLQADERRTFIAADESGHRDDRGPHDVEVDCRRKRVASTRKVYLG